MSKQNSENLTAIPGFPEHSITISGNVWSHKQERWVAHYKNQCRGNYWVVTLYQNGRQYTKYVHRLLLETFVGPCPKGMECRHLNGDAEDNRIINLVWGTRVENTQDQIRHGTKKHPVLLGENNAKSYLTQTEVKWIKWLHKNKVFACKEISEIFMAHIHTIYNILECKTWINV